MQSEQRKKDCLTCRYVDITSSDVLCLYILRTGHRRPCEVGKCREAGVWRRRPHYKRFRGVWKT